MGFHAIPSGLVLHHLLVTSQKQRVCHTLTLPLVYLDTLNSHLPRIVPESVGRLRCNDEYKVEHDEPTQIVIPQILGYEPDVIDVEDNGKQSGTDKQGHRVRQDTDKAFFPHEHHLREEENHHPRHNVNHDFQYMVPTLVLSHSVSVLFLIFRSLQSVGLSLSEHPLAGYSYLIASMGFIRAALRAGT